MKRRKFLALLGIGAPAAALSVHTGVGLDLARKFFGRKRAADYNHPFENNGASSGICSVCGGIAPDHKTVLLSYGGARVVKVGAMGKLHANGWRVLPSGVISHDGQVLWPHYLEDGSLAPGWIRYRLRDNHIESEHVTIHDLVSISA